MESSNKISIKTKTIVDILNCNNPAHGSVSVDEKREHNPKMLFQTTGKPQAIQSIYTFTNS